MEANNMAAMREALVRCADIINNFGLAERVNTAMEVICDIEGVVSAALSAPPRNCDLPLVVDGPANNNADKAWRVFKRHNPGAYFDVPGLLRCIDWLLAPTTEQKGETNGSK